MEQAYEDWRGGVQQAIAKDLEAAGESTTYDKFTAEGRKLDQMSVAEWIDTRVPGGRKSPLGALLDVAYAIEYGADTTDQSALNIVYLLGREQADRGRRTGSTSSAPRTSAITFAAATSSSRPASPGISETPCSSECA